MKTNNDMATKMATFLLQVKAIKLNNEHPFTWASGRKSPIYCDNRVTLSYPEIRTFIRQRFVDVINENWGEVDVIAGVATGGIAQGALVAQELGKPFVYVRSEAKSHGLTNQIEGEIHEGQSVVVIEDLVSTGKSSLVAVRALREKGCVVKGMAAIFTYGLDVAARNFADELLSKIEVRGVAWSGTGDNTGVVITSVFETPNGLKTCINTPRIKMATISFGFEEELEIIVESIKKEVYAYLFKGKQAQMSLFGENGPADDEPDPLDGPDDMPGE